MPASDHLQWFEISDMTPGVWDTQAAYTKFTAPPNAFVTLNDYQGLKGGGLRPWFQGTAVSLSGVGASEIPTGIYARSGVIRTGAGGTGNASSDLVLVTFKTSDKKFRIYRLDGTVAAPAWSLRYTSGAGADDAHKHVDFAAFKDVNGLEWLIMSIFINSGSEGGLLKMQYDYTVASNTGSDGAVSVIENSYKGPMTVSQARIMATRLDTIYYSNTGLTTFVPGTLAVAPNRGENIIVGISQIDPSDLLIAKDGAPWVEINGDITVTSTPVREMGLDHVCRNAKQFLVRTPSGVAFIEPEGRVCETDGRNFKTLSDQLGGRTLTWSNNMVDAGVMAYLDGYLVAPGTNSVTTGLVYDYNTGGWFRTTQLNPVFSWADVAAGRIYSVNHDGTTPSLMYFDLMGGTRVTTGVIQTVPYADKNGRNIDIREVQLFTLASSATEFKVELIDQSDSSVVTRYVTVPSGRREMAKVQFPATKSEYLSVKITPRAVDGSSEAPTIERIRIGFGITNLIS